MTDRADRVAKLGNRLISDDLIQLARRQSAAKDDLQKFRSSGYFIMYHRWSPRPNESAQQSREAARLLLLQYGQAMGLKPRLHHATAVPLMFVDGGVKRDSPERPQLMEALYASEPGDIILAVDPDRISNDEMFYAAIETTVHEAGCRFEFTDGTPPATDEYSELIRAIRLFASRTELKKKRKRSKDHFLNMRKVGLWPAYAHRPYGHDKVVIGKNAAGRNVYQLVENREEQAVILYMLMLRCQGPYRGGGYAAIAKRLNAEGIKPCQGESWWPLTVSMVLAREFDRYGIPPARNRAEIEDQIRALQRMGIARPGKKVRPWSERKHDMFRLTKPAYKHPPNQDESLLFNDAINKETDHD